jgi:hypothetical protein
MEKYGVVVEEEPPKEATDKLTPNPAKPVCPACQEELEKGANVPKCPQHGTRPFEK